MLPEGAQLDLAREYLKRALEELGLDEVGELAVTLLCGDSESHKKYAEGVQGLYRESLGLKIKVESVDFATFLERIRNRQFSLMYLGWNADFNDPSAFMDLWITDGPYNDAGYSNEIYDTAIEIARSGTDNKTRMEALAEAERILCEDLPIIPLYWPTRNYITRPYVKTVRRLPVPTTSGNIVGSSRGKINRFNPGSTAKEDPVARYLIRPSFYIDRLFTNSDLNLCDHEIIAGEPFLNPKPAATRQMLRHYTG